MGGVDAQKMTLEIFVLNAKSLGKGNFKKLVGWAGVAPSMHHWIYRLT